MTGKTKIEWADSTFNPWIGCTKVSTACDLCYAAVSAPARVHGIVWGAGKPRQRTSASNWNQPLTWERGHEKFFAENGHRRRVFCASLADVFDNEVDPQWRADLFDLILATPNLDWLLLTKRIGNAQSMLDAYVQSDGHTGERWTGWPNVWLGATIVNQEEADRDIPKLLAVPATKRFLSMEPLLGSVDLTRVVYPMFKQKDANDPYVAYDTLRGHMIGPDDVGLPKLDWVIAGGESGSGARPSHPDWYRLLRDQCAAAGVPFLFKQWGEWLPGQNEMHIIGHKVAHHQDGSWGATGTKITSKNYVAWDASGGMHFGDLSREPLCFRVSAWAERVGKKAAGRLLDGIEHNGFPS